MQPYINPNYYNQYQPNYFSQYGNPYGYQQNNQQAPGIVGRVVANFEDIVANDVPMDGRSAVFPKSDLSEIQIRNWGADGKIQTKTYKPILEQNVSQTTDTPDNAQNVKIDLSDASTEVFMRRFDDIANRLVELEQSLAKINRGSRTKKEVDAE